MPRIELMARRGNCRGAIAPSSGLASRQRGQTLVLAMVCMVVFVVGVLVLFNTGQAVNKKVQLNNTADAAAYSVAVQQARAYNLIAYLNRAQVANEVAVAQMVSLHSWLNYTISGTDHFADAASDIGWALDFTGVGVEIGVVLNEVGNALSEVKEGLQEARDGTKLAFSGFITVLSTANQLYSEASQAVLIADLGDVPIVAKNVVAANAAANTTDKPMALNVASYGVLESQAVVANQQYVRLYKVPHSVTANGNPGRTSDGDRYANVVMEARDGFSRDRNADFFVLHKRGGTDIVGYNRWVGLDSLNMNIHIPLPFVPDVNLALAWGGAAAVLADTRKGFDQITKVNNGWTSPYDNDRGTYAPYNGGGDNGSAGGKARSEPAESGDGYDYTKALLTGYHGLLSYEDVVANKATVPYVNDGDTNRSDDAGPIFSVLVEQKMADIRTSSNIPKLANKNDLVVPDKMQNDKMTGLASAQVYFDRPQSLFPRANDSRRELGSLFSPYWQARLIDTPKTVKAEIFAADAVGI
jgi:competence protein ComGC